MMSVSLQRSDSVGAFRLLVDSLSVLITPDPDGRKSSARYLVQDALAAVYLFSHLLLAHLKNSRLSVPSIFNPSSSVRSLVAEGKFGNMIAPHCVSTVCV